MGINSISGLDLMFNFPQTIVMWIGVYVMVIKSIAPTYLMCRYVLMIMKYLQVCANWLQDLESYNEWMNEEDYEVDENGMKKKHRSCLSVDDTMGLSDPDKKKKNAKKRPRSPPSPRTKRKG